MHWNINEIKERIAELEARLDKLTDTTKIIAIKQDVATLNKMLSYIYVAKSDQSIEIPVFEDNQKSKNEGVIKYLCDLSYLMLRTSFQHRLPWKFTIAKSIEEVEYCELVNHFTESFSKDFYLFFRKLYFMEHIELNSKKYGDSFCKGKTYPMYFAGLPYVSARFNGKVSSSSYLIHELAHGYQMNKVTDYNSINSMLNSPLREAFAIFMELLFIEFLKETKYEKNAFALQYDRLDAFLVSSEYIYPKILNLDGASMVGEKIHLQTGHIISNHEYTVFISYLFAFYIFELYKKDKEKAYKFIRLFNINYRNGTEFSWFKFINQEELIYSSQKVIGSYIKSYNKK